MSTTASDKSARELWESIDPEGDSPYAPDAPRIAAIAAALRAARADALEEAAKATCSGCAEGLPLVTMSHDGLLRHEMRGGGNTLPCHAAAIRALKAAG